MKRRTVTEDEFIAATTDLMIGTADEKNAAIDTMHDVWLELLRRRDEDNRTRAKLAELRALIEQHQDKGACGVEQVPKRSWSLRYATAAEIDAAGIKR